jgi:uncharacterized protein YqeY
MTLRERLDADMKDAMRAKDQLRLDVVRAVKSAVKYREVEGDKAVVLEEPAILQVVGTEIKKRRDAAEQFRAAHRQELAAKEEAELAILQAYLPAQLTPEELARKVDEAIARTGAKGPRDMGAVMKALQPEVQGRAEGKAVSELVKQKLAPR